MHQDTCLVVIANVEHAPSACADMLALVSSWERVAMLAYPMNVGPLVDCLKTYVLNRKIGSRVRGKVEWRPVIVVDGKANPAKGGVMPVQGLHIVTAQLHPHSTFTHELIMYLVET